MTRTQMRAYARVQASVSKRASLNRMLEQATLELTDAVANAASTGIPLNFLAEVTGLSDGRIWQLVNNWQPKRGKKSVNE